MYNSRQTGSAALIHQITEHVKYLLYIDLRGGGGECSVLYNFGLPKKIEFLSVQRIKDPQEKRG
jgi:hypothetical protein